MKKGWLFPPALFFALVAALMATWALVEPATLVENFDQGGYSPFELATIPFYLAIVPFVWWKCPFAGSRRRRVALCAMVSVVALMAVVKELDLHVKLLHALYPDFVTEGGQMQPGILFRKDGTPRAGTPFKMPALRSPAVPLGMKAFVVAYFALFFGTFAAGFAYLFATWVKGVIKLEPAAWAWGCFGGSGVLVQVADRLPSWLGHAHGLDKHAEGGASAASALCTCLEEGGEMMIAVFALLTIYLGWRSRRQEAG